MNMRGFSSELGAIYSSEKVKEAWFLNALAQGGKAAAKWGAGSATAAGKGALNWAKGVPGQFGTAVKDLATPIKSAKEIWHADGNWGKAFNIGGTALGLPGALSKEDPSGEGRSRLDRLSGIAAGSAVGHVTSRAGLLPSLAFSIGADVATGKAVGAVVGRKKPIVPASQATMAPPPAPGVSE